MKKYYTNFKIWGYNAIFNFVITKRSRGKTFSFLARALGRARKHGEKTLIVRRYRAEADEAKTKLVNADFIKKYNLAEKNYKQDGNKWYIKRGDKWHCWLEITYLARVKAWRGARESNIYTVIFDEFTTTPEKYKFYRGNEVDDFLDIVASVKGEHDIRVFFLGNKESVTNPYFNYFKIPYIEEDFNGIRRYSPEFVVEYHNGDAPDEMSKEEERFANALKGTRYGDYLSKGSYKHGAKNIVAFPQNSTLVMQFDFSAPVSVYRYKGNFYAKKGVDKSRLVFTETPHGYKFEQVLRTKDKILFESLANAYKFNRFYYVDESAFEAFNSVSRFLAFK